MTASVVASPPRIFQRARVPTLLASNRLETVWNPHPTVMRCPTRNPQSGVVPCTTNSIPSWKIALGTSSTSLHTARSSTTCGYIQSSQIERVKCRATRPVLLPKSAVREPTSTTLSLYPLSSAWHVSAFSLSSPQPWTLECAILTLIQCHLCSQNEYVYIRQPLGFSDGTLTLCHLKRCLNGLK
jgi:hypothetical protein